ncbi:NAD-glutamate dehydrogenase [Limoniibacter endophyticus]|uniref:NAD-glutamate dehydrogenase n=1 Tax=Limoniibacter endophyticus TaxID=1565040 RepID=A0A8J3DI26_9HYPH|nr:NAD-glutamate dehydrogenase [Limoniibacter endophyticus]
MLNETAATTAQKQQSLIDLILARAPEEDVAAYDPATLREIVATGSAAIADHSEGASIVRIETKSEFLRGAHPVSAITIVNDNMPFLFDSVLGEISEQLGEPYFVSHPVLLVSRDAGKCQLIGEADQRVPEAAKKLSVIQIHVPAMSDASAKALETALLKILDYVHAAVRDWQPMLTELSRVTGSLREGKTPLAKTKLDEAISFLEWLSQDNFTFLGMRRFRYVGEEESGNLELVDGKGLGILADDDVRVLRRGAEPVTTTPEIRAFLHGPQPLIVTKANAKSVVHRRAYMDYVGVKTFDEAGKLSGELRIVGLFTSTAYTRSVFHIPYVRSKVEAVIAKLGYSRHDHSGKALLNVLESYPRDELFQTTVPVLQRHAEAILALGERPRVRVLMRIDQFDRFASVIVFVPRDRYDTGVREKIGEFLKYQFNGRVSAYYPAFPEGSLTRVHFIIGRNRGDALPHPDERLMEDGIRQIIRVWSDMIISRATETDVPRDIVSLALKFPQGYREFFGADDALRDAAVLKRVSAGSPIAIDYYRRPHAQPQEAGLKIYHFGEPVALSRRVPLLENMGFKVIAERTFEIELDDGNTVYLHDMDVENGDGAAIDLSDEGELFEDVFLAAWNGIIDNDAYNGLAQSAALKTGEIVVIRAYGRYLQQVGIPQSQDYIAAALNRYPDIVRALFNVFASRLDPAFESDRDEAVRQTKAGIKSALNAVPNIDDDTIIRRLLNLIEATLRTNYFMPSATKQGISLAFKLDPHSIDGLPDPKPWREIFVYGAELEGVHLRFGPVARGGLRWSDRAQDYRTEVLGLVKAQQVKNAVIVPVGAKGGFYPKQLPVGGNRDAIFEAGRQAYINFISSMLSITDNLDGDKVIAPAHVVRHDGDDPYFVVAADKGTATFSDTANGISQSRDFWLDDAFASGGSAGYDHKKMGITARGAWEAVKRHFREMDHDIQKKPFTVVGVGDMSGDVFGNGMLLSRCTKLIAAFDHRDIFIDPTPDPEVSFEERTRVYALGRSSWQDYDKAKLSEGGMIVPRNQKSITLTPQAAAVLDLPAGEITPVKLIQAILKAKADLLWFGGIGTYIRATHESNQDIGDRSNDPVRITAADLRVKVVGEGANLGMSQFARIQFGLNGGRCNSDAIDNSAGVNSSDVEVNIKIALASAMRSGRLTREDRNVLLAQMTDEVARLVLANNYEQTLALSMTHQLGLTDLANQARFMKALEDRGLLDRVVENLPSQTALEERQAKGEALTRAELGVLLAYAKIVLFNDVIASHVPDEVYFAQELTEYFPKGMVSIYAEEIASHRLRREIITTTLVNDLVNRGGPSFVNRMEEETGRTAADIVHAFTLVREGYDLRAVYTQIDALDNKIEGKAQLALYATVADHMNSAVAWFLKNDSSTGPLGERIERLRRGREALANNVQLMPEFMKEKLEERRFAYVKAGAPAELAERLAILPVEQMIPDIEKVAESADADLSLAAKAYVDVSGLFPIGRIEDAARMLRPADYYDGLALARSLDLINQAWRGIAVAALRRHGAGADPVGSWLEDKGAHASIIRDRLLSLIEGDLNVSRMTVAAGLMADLAN